jgi:hypothetical protein
LKAFFEGGDFSENCMRAVREIDQKRDQTVCRPDALNGLISTDQSNIGVEVLDPSLELISEVFDLDDTCFKYLLLKLWLWPRGDEGAYTEKVTIRSINLSKDCGY